MRTAGGRDPGGRREPLQAAVVCLLVLWAFSPAGAIMTEKGVRADEFSGAVTVGAARAPEAVELAAVPAVRYAQSGLDEPIRDPFDEEMAAPPPTVPDPLEPLNRAFFVFNDKLYFWVLKPVARAYRAVLPQPARVAVRNVFRNLGSPVRAVNCLLQGKVDGLGRELLRFFVNSTAGMGGLADVAQHAWQMGPEDEDFGQTLGRAGAGAAVFINWPLLGPSNLRDTIGLVGDFFLSPFNYLTETTEGVVALWALREVNETSLRIGEFEAFKKAALDPYVAMRDAYHQNRESKIAE